VNPYVAIGTAGAILAAGVWGGYQLGAARYIVGFQEGVRSQQKISDAELARLLADSRAEVATAVQEATQAILDKEKARHESEAQQRALAEKEAASVATTLASLRGRLRNATARPYVGSPNPVPSASPSPTGPVNGADDARDIHDDSGILFDLAGAAEWEAGRYRSCYRWVSGLSQ